MADSSKPICRYGAKCYRKNADHFKQYVHPKKDSSDNEEEAEEVPKGKVEKRKNGVEEKAEKSSDIDQFEEKNDGEKAENSSPEMKKARTAQITSGEASTASNAKKPTKKGTMKESVENGEKNTQEKTEDEKLATKPFEGDFVVIPKMTSLADKKKFISEYFLVEMPPDFYALWDLATKLKPKDPRMAFEDVDLTLGGPFDVLAGRFENLDEKEAKHLTTDSFLVHCRYFYDVPEFQTVIFGKENGFHLGYLRDEPLQKQQPIVVSNLAAKDSRYVIMGDNLFAAVFNVACDVAKKEKGESGVKSLCKKIEEAAKHGGFSMENRPKSVKDRQKKVVAKTFHEIGIVVEIKGDVGYRELPETDANLKKQLMQIGEASVKDEDLYRNRLSKLQEIITYVQFANDEGDYGMGYELGIDMFCSGQRCLHSRVQQVLSVAYDLLNRQDFGRILRAHLKRRIAGDNVDVLEQLKNL